MIGPVSHAVLHALTLHASNAPNPAPQAPPGLGTTASTFLSWEKWIALIVGVGGLMFCGIQMSAGRRNRSMLAAEGAAGIPWVIAGLTVVSFAASIVGFLVV